MSQARGLKKTDRPAAAPEAAAFDREVDAKRQATPDGATFQELDREHRLTGKPRSNGFGESRTFVAQYDGESDGRIPLEELHFNGVLFTELPQRRQDVLHMFPNSKFMSDEHVNRIKLPAPPMTEDEREEFNRRPRQGANTDFTGFTGQEEGFSADYTRALGPMREHLLNHGDSEEGPNPKRELMLQHVPPGMTGKFLSKSVIASRGMRGFKLAMEGGKPVEFGNMLLGMKPTALVQAKRRRQQQLHNEIIGHAVKTQEAPLTRRELEDPERD